MASSTESEPHFLNCLKSPTLFVVKGDVNRNVFMPNLIGGKVSSKNNAESQGVNEFSCVYSGRLLPKETLADLTKTKRLWVE